MKILILNDKLIGGGTEIYALNLKHLLEEVHEVKYMYFSNEENVKNEENIISISMNPKNILDKFILKFFSKKKYYLELKNEIKKFNPDKIVINNIFFSPFSVLKALEGYEVYQVVHDYSLVCPKSTCIMDNKKVCSGFECKKCLKKCHHNGNKISMFLKLIQMRKEEKFRKKIIKKFICPSGKLCEYMINYGYDAVTLNNAIDTSINFKIEKNKDFLYIGEISEKKGVFDLLDAFQIFQKKYSASIDIIGNVIEKQEIFNSYLNDNIHYLGKVSHDEIIKKIGEYRYLLVPSLCMENYPTTVLEGFLCKLLVIGSNRGGIPEMLEDRGLIFNIEDKDDIIKKLEEAYLIDDDKYEKIVEKNLKFVKEHNCFEKYKNEFLKIIGG